MWLAQYSSVASFIATQLAILLITTMYIVIKTEGALTSKCGIVYIGSYSYYSYKQESDNL